MCYYNTKVENFCGDKKLFFAKKKKKPQRILHSPNSPFTVRKTNNLLSLEKYFMKTAYFSIDNFSRNFCDKMVSVNFNNFHTVSSSVSKAKAVERKPIFLTGRCYFLCLKSPKCKLLICKRNANFFKV